MHVCVAGEFEPVPELPTFTTRESDQPTVPHLPKYQVHSYHIHNIILQYSILKNIAIEYF